MNILPYIFLNSFALIFRTRLIGHGYPAHFIIGAFLGGLVFHLVYKKTTSHLKSWIIALTIVSAIGLAKEIIDPLLGRQRDKLDLVITILGGIIGVAIVILFKNNKTK
jgi:VanZ family protein